MSRPSSGANVACSCSSFASCRDLLEAAFFARELGEHRLGRGIDEQALHVGEELVAGRARHGPRAQGLVGGQDLLDPDVARARVAQTAEVARGVGQAVDVVDTQAGHDPGSHEAQHRRVRGREDLGILDPHPRQLVDVEEPAVAAGLRVDVEEPGALLLVGPERVQLVDGHVVGHDVEDHADPGRGQRLQRRLPPEVGRDLRRVDDVVPVRRALARLEHRRQVDVAHAEVDRGTGRARAPRGRARSGPSWSR